MARSNVEQLIINQPWQKIVLTNGRMHKTSRKAKSLAIASLLSCLPVKGKCRKARRRVMKYD